MTPIWKKEAFFSPLIDTCGIVSTKCRAGSETKRKRCCIKTNESICSNHWFSAFEPLFSWRRRYIILNVSSPPENENLLSFIQEKNDSRVESNKWLSVKLFCLLCDDYRFSVTIYFALMWHLIWFLFANIYYRKCNQFIEFHAWVGNTAIWWN